MSSQGRGRPFKIIKSYEARALKRRPLTIKIADAITSFAGSVTFLVLNICFFGSWLFINIGVIPGIKPFDPYPFVMLTTLVSLEAILLAIFVLMSQNRQSIISSLRDEIQLQVNLISEKEVTKVLSILDLLLDKYKIKLDDEELHEMIKDTDLSYIERQLEKEMNPSPQPIVNTDEIAKALKNPIGGQGQKKK